MTGHGSALKRSVDVGKVMGNADPYHYVNEPILELYRLCRAIATLEKAKLCRQ